MNKILLIFLLIIILIIIKNKNKESFLNLLSNNDKYNYYWYKIIEHKNQYLLDYNIIIESSYTFNGYTLSNSTNKMKYIHGHGYIFDINFENYRYFTYKMNENKNKDESYNLYIYFPPDYNTKLTINNNVEYIKIKINSGINYINIKNDIFNKNIF